MAKVKKQGVKLGSGKGGLKLQGDFKAPPAGKKALGK